MSARTDRTTWAQAAPRAWVGVADLLEHLTAMGDSESVVGVANAAAAREAHDLIVRLAACDSCDEVALDLEHAEVQR